nr:high mobility group B protein 15-like [Tanacetum cinerariifolium]
RTDFASRQQHIRLYCRGKENGVNILKSIDEGSFQMGIVWETLAEGTEGAPHLVQDPHPTFSILDTSVQDSCKTQFLQHLMFHHPRKTLRSCFNNCLMSTSILHHAMFLPFQQLLLLQELLIYGSLSSTTIDQDVPSASTSPTTQEIQSQVTHQGAEEQIHGHQNAQFDNAPLFRNLSSDPSSEETTLQGFLPSNLHHLNQSFDTLTKLTMNCPLENVICDPSRSVLTRSQLQGHAICLLNAGCKKALNLLKKGSLIRGEAVEASKRRRSLLDHKIQLLSKGSSEGSEVTKKQAGNVQTSLTLSSAKVEIQSMVDVPIHQEDPDVQRTPLIDTIISMVTDKTTSTPTPPTIRPLAGNTFQEEFRSAGYIELPIGLPVSGVMDGKFESGYLCTMRIGGEQLYGVLYQTVQTSSYDIPKEGCFPYKF